MTSTTRYAHHTQITKEGAILKQLILAELEDRCSLRTALCLPAKVTFEELSDINLTIKNICLSGFACHALSSLELGTYCWLNIPGVKSIQAEIVWKNGNIIGCAFHSLISQTILDSLIARYSKPTIFND